MPYGTNNPGGGGEDYFESNGTKSPKVEGEMEDEHMPSAVLPKSILAGKHFEVGDKVELTITGIHDDEVTVEYSYGDKDKGAESEPAETPTPDENSMAAMMS